jgi:hypothetical protein
MRIRVFRLLIYEGEKSWVEKTLESSIQDGNEDKFDTGYGTITSQTFRENDVILEE